MTKLRNMNLAELNQAKELAQQGVRAGMGMTLVFYKQRLKKVQKHIDLKSTIPQVVYRVVCGVWGPKLQEFKTIKHDGEQGGENISICDAHGCYLPLIFDADTFHECITDYDLYPTKKAAVKAFEKGYRADIKAAWALIKKPAD